MQRLVSTLALTLALVPSFSYAASVSLSNPDLVLSSGCPSEGEDFIYVFGPVAAGDELTATVSEIEAPCGTPYTHVHGEPGERLVVVTGASAAALSIETGMTLEDWLTAVGTFDYTQGANCDNSPVVSCYLLTIAGPSETFLASSVALVGTSALDFGGTLLLILAAIFGTLGVGYLVYQFGWRKINTGHFNFEDATTHRYMRRFNIMKSEEGAQLRAQREGKPWDYYLKKQDSFSVYSGKGRYRELL